MLSQPVMQRPLNSHKNISFSMFSIYLNLHLIWFLYNILIEDMDCQLIFSCNNCQTQDKVSFKTVNLAELSKELYFLHQFSVNQLCINKVQNCKESQTDIWHIRLGHPSNIILEQMCKLFPYICFIEIKMFVMFVISKQHKLPFLL